MALSLTYVLREIFAILSRMISPEEITLSTSRCVLFKGLDLAAQEKAIDIGRVYPLDKDTFLFHQEEQANTFYILLRGAIKLVQITPEGHQITVDYVTEGGGIGIIVALSNTVYPVTAEVVQKSWVIAWGQDSLNELMLEYPQLALNGLRLIADYFVRLQNRHQELATERVERRVARALLRLVRQTGKKVDGGILIDMPLSRQDLAEMTGTTLYTASRILSGWEKEGLVATGREQVTLCNPHKLVVIAEDLPE